MQVELKKGETIMTDASLHLSAAFLHEAFSDRSGVPPDHFELYYRGKRLEGEAALASYGIGKDATIEVKMRGRGGMGDQEGKQPQVPDGEPPSPSKDYVAKKLWDAQDVRVAEIKPTKGVGASAAADSSAEQHLAGEEDRSMEAPEAVIEKAASAKKAATKGAVAEKDAAEKDQIVATVGANKAGTGDTVSPPAHDVDLSKLLSTLLRHKAVELGVAIDADGWVALSDALTQINGPRLRELVGNAKKLGSHMYTEADVCTSASHMYTEADVRDVVNANDKRRFVLSDDDTQIRAAQGHSMHGVGEKQGEPLTLLTAPEVAVHGSYVKHVQAILEQGLSRMDRHHVHLAKGLLGEEGVISGMRRNAEIFIWIDVHDAIKAGLTFFESANGVILCSGQNGDGIIPSAYLYIVTDSHGGSTRKPAQASFARFPVHAIAYPSS